MSLEDKLHRDLLKGHLVLDRQLKEFKEGQHIPINLERALLILSGANTEWKLKRYIAKIDKINAKFQRYYVREIDFLKKEEDKNEGKHIDEKDSNLILKTLHDYLWETKPGRFVKGKSSFKKAIDAQLCYLKRKVGDSVALTSLYTVLALRNLGSNDNLDILTATTFHGISFTRLKFKKFREYIYVITDLEHTKSTVFKSGRYQSVKCEEDKETNYLHFLSDVLIARGKEKLSKQDDDGALQDYKQALRFNPNNSTVYTQIGLLRCENNDLWAAAPCFRKALEMNSSDCVAKVYLEEVNRKIREQQ